MGASIGSCSLGAFGGKDLLEARDFCEFYKTKNYHDIHYILHDKMNHINRRHRNVSNLFNVLFATQKNRSGTVSHLPTCLPLWLLPSLTPQACAEELGGLKADLILLIKESEDQV